MKRISLAYLVFLSAFPQLAAQDPHWDWIRALHTGDSEIATAVASDPNSGDVYLAGEWRGSLVDQFPVGVTETTDLSATFGGADGLVAKLDPDGKYNFLLKATNSEGISHSDPVRFQIIIARSLWNRWWFYAVIIALINGWMAGSRSMISQSWESGSERLNNRTKPLNLVFTISES